MSVRAYDLGTPQLTSIQQASITIIVLRNANCPVFSNLPRSINISQSQSTLNSIYDINATDADVDVGVPLCFYIYVDCLSSVQLFICKGASIFLHFKACTTGKPRGHIHKAPMVKN